MYLALQRRTGRHHHEPLLHYLADIEAMQLPQTLCHLPSLKPSVLGADPSVHGQLGGVPLQRLVPLPIAVKGGKLESHTMHMLRTCVSTVSCILLQNLHRKEMARSTAASAGQYVRNNARTRHTFTHRACALSSAKAPHILDICTGAKCYTMCSLRPSHCTKARSQFTCAASNSSWCEAINSGTDATAVAHMRHAH